MPNARSTSWVIGIFLPFSSHMRILFVVVEEVVELWPKERSIDDVHVLGSHHNWVEFGVEPRLGLWVKETAASIPLFHTVGVNVAHDIDDVLPVPEQHHDALQRLHVVLHALDAVTLAIRIAIVNKDNYLTIWVVSGRSRRLPLNIRLQALHPMDVLSRADSQVGMLPVVGAMSFGPLLGHRMCVLCPPPWPIIAPRHRDPISLRPSYRRKFFFLPLQ